MRTSLAIAIGVSIFLSCAVADVHAQRGARGPRRRDAAFQKDRALFHFLLSNRKHIRRKVTNRKDGVQTLTESDNPQVARKIQQHVESMHQRLKHKRPIHLRDPLFAAIFRNADKITVNIEKTKAGVKVTETSRDAHVVKLLQAHAKVVSKFLANGHAEVRKNHPLPGK